MQERPGQSDLPHWKEVERLAALQSFDILDTEPDVQFDSIAKLAAQICNTPIACISFLDEHRQWFKARIGLELTETPREKSVCNHAILQPGLFVVSDFNLDPRFDDRTQIDGQPCLSFYAGFPLKTRDGLPLGMLCVLDYVARPDGLTEQQEEALVTLAEAVMCQVELKLARKTAAENDEFVRRLLASSDDCIEVFDLKGNLRFMSQGGMRAMEVEDFRTIEGRHWTEIWGSIASEGSTAAVEAVKSGGIGRFQGPCATMTGAQKWWDAVVTPIMRQDGDPQGFLCISRDITDFRATEDRLRRSEERLQLALKAAHMIAWEFKPQSGATTRSDNSMALLGITSGLDRNFMTGIHRDDHQKVEGFLREIQSHGASSIECRYVLPSGETRWLRARGEEAGPDRIVGVTFDISEQKEAEKEIWRSANHDALTGLPNRTLFQHRLDAALDHARQSGTSVSLLLIDLDDFKDINDTLGHDAGDALLQETARRLSTMVRGCDTVARIGGDEFAVLVGDPMKLEDATGLGSSIVEMLRQPFIYQKRTLINRVSIGIAAYPDHDGNPAELIKDADIAMYQAKSQGRNRVITYSPEMRNVIEQRVSLGRGMREAIANDEIVPFYQPKICLTTGEIIGLEALARWRHPTEGILTPEYFGAVFEDHDIAASIGKKLITKVAADVRSWLDKDLLVGRIALNLSPAEFGQAAIVDNLLRTLDRLRVPASFFEVEVTETVLLGRNSDNVSSVLAEFRQQGIQIALDDFGTGYASLTHLKQFPVDHIKIDRSFVRDLEQGSDDEAIVAAVISLGNSLQLQVTAEGVETHGQARRLRDLGCDHAQGFLYAKPMAASQVPGLVSRWNSMLVRSRSDKMEERLGE